MSDIFLSHAEPDSGVAREIAAGLEDAGYTTWYYERDSVPGPSYLIQTGEAIERAHAVVLIASSDALSSHQVTKEVVRAHEAGKPFIPILLDITHTELQERQPEWRGALGGHVSLSVPAEGVRAVHSRLVGGLEALGIPSRGLPGSEPTGDAGREKGVDSRPSDSPGDEMEASIQTLVLTPDTRERLLDLVENIISKLTELGYDPQTINNAEFVFRELVENALEHGCPEGGDGEIRIELRISPNYFKCVVEDDGPGFDVESVISHAEEEAADTSRERGRGLVLVKGKSDELHFSAGGSRAAATLWMAKFKGGVTAAAPEDITEGREVAVFRLEERLDVSNAGRLKVQFTQAFEDGAASALILDLSGCEYVDSTGLGMVIKAHTMWAAKRGLVIAGVRPSVMELFQITRLDSIFRFADTIEDARRVLAQ